MIDEHLETWESENHVSDEDTTWLAWTAEAGLRLREAGFCIAEHEWTNQNTMPIGLDGDQRVHGFSLDDAYTKWTNGCTPAEYLDQVKRNRFELRL